MKLYATVTSERATKGQGGEYLDIEIQNEARDVIATIKVRDQYSNGTDIVVWHGNSATVTAYKDCAMDKKGEQKKGEMTLHPCYCGSTMVHTHE